MERIDQIVEKLGLRLKRTKCAAMEGLVEEGKDVIDAIEKGPFGMPLWSQVTKKLNTMKLRRMAPYQR